MKIEFETLPIINRFDLLEQVKLSKGPTILKKTWVIRASIKKRRI